MQLSWGMYVPCIGIIRGDCGFIFFDLFNYVFEFELDSVLGTYCTVIPTQSVD